jgi:hypothetical protein
LPHASTTSRSAAGSPPPPPPNPTDSSITSMLRRRLIRLVNLRHVSCLPVPPCNRRSDRSIRGNRRPAPCAATADRGGHGTTTSTQCEFLKASSPFSLSPPIGSKSCRTSCRRRDCRRRDTSELNLSDTAGSVHVAAPSILPTPPARQEGIAAVGTPTRRRKWPRRRAVHPPYAAYQKGMGLLHSSTSDPCIHPTHWCCCCCLIFVFNWYLWCAGGGGDSRNNTEAIARYTNELSFCNQMLAYHRFAFTHVYWYKHL